MVESIVFCALSWAIFCFLFLSLSLSSSAVVTRTTSSEAATADDDVPEDDSLPASEYITSMASWIRVLRLCCRDSSEKKMQARFFFIPILCAIYIQDEAPVFLLHSEWNVMLIIFGWYILLWFFFYAFLALFLISMGHYSFLFKCRN